MNQQKKTNQLLIHQLYKSGHFLDFRPEGLDDKPRFPSPISEPGSVANLDLDLPLASPAALDSAAKVLDLALLVGDTLLDVE
jgi:hypothetical protein